MMCAIKACYILAMELWVHVSRLLVAHLDKDRWKCTMFTNKFIFHYVPVTTTQWLTYIQDETIQYDGIHYNNK